MVVQELGRELEEDWRLVLVVVVEPGPQLKWYLELEQVVSR